MATKKQIEANRLNASKSTGPRTPGGKRRSAMNALRSGIDAKSQVIQGEYEGDLNSLQYQYYDRFQPSTPEQRMLVDSLIDCEWLLRRFRSCEAQLWGEVTQRTFHTTVLAEAFRGNVDSFSRLQRRVDATQRTYRSVLHELERLQAQEESLATSEDQTEKPENGFVPHPPIGPDGLPEPIEDQMANPHRKPSPQTQPIASPAS